MIARAKGFTLVEVITVVVIIMILSAILVPSIQRINLAYKMDASGHSIVGLLNQARLQAVHNNAPAYVQFNAGVDPTRAFVNNDGSANYAAGDPDIAVSGGVQLVQNPGALDHKQLDTYLGITPAGGPISNIGTRIGFSARGLPCLQGAAPAVCQQQPVFEWFMTDGNGSWEAVTVTVAGRIRAWRYTGQGTWQ